MSVLRTFSLSSGCSGNSDTAGERRVLSFIAGIGGGFLVPWCCCCLVSKGKRHTASHVDLDLSVKGGERGEKKRVVECKESREQGEKEIPKWEDVGFVYLFCN